MFLCFYYCSRGNSDTLRHKKNDSSFPSLLLVARSIGPDVQISMDFVVKIISNFQISSLPKFRVVPTPVQVPTEGSNPKYTTSTVVETVEESQDGQGEFC